MEGEDSNDCSQPDNRQIVVTGPSNERVPRSVSTHFSTLASRQQPAW